MTGDLEDRNFTVVVNHEEQYSVWPSDRAVPDGWRDAGFTGERQACLDWIAETWVDMRPLSLRKAMDARAERQG